MDRSFEVFLGRHLNEYSQEATRHRANWLCEQAKGRVLDVGCSQGLVPWLLAHKGMEVVGVDMDAEAIAWARENMKNATPDAQSKASLVCTDFLQYISDNPFDTILAGEYLEHLSDDVLARHLAHMAQMLAPKGKVVITVPLGLHPHPDHEQTFLPGNFTEKIGEQFSILQMEVQDAYLRCVCDLSYPRQRPDMKTLLGMAENGIIQLQQKARAGKRATKVAEILGQTKLAQYLRKKPVQTENNLTRKLAAKGLWAPFVYDRYLFKTLNEIYRVHPLVPQPRDLSPEGLFAQADKRVDYLQLHFGDLHGARCLEVGCGSGETSLRLAQRCNCVMTGVDAFSFPEWQEQQSGTVQLLELDLTRENPLQPASFDYVISFAALEQMEAPLTMLEVIFTLLKPGGKAYVTANLHRGPMASHLYREVFFPWPHLLFEDSVFIRFYKDLDGREENNKPAWVNRLTHLHYLDKVNQLGFEILRCSYSTRPFDNDFYECFAEKLNCFPKEDLEKDFINLMLRKPG